MSLESRKSEIIQQDYKQITNKINNPGGINKEDNLQVEKASKTLIKGRIISSKMDNFGVFQYTIWSQSQFWNGIGSSNKVLEIGKNYTFEGKIRSFELDQSGKKFANYDLSLGITGLIEIEKVKNVDQNCSLECLFWQKLNQSRRSWQNFYQTELCGSFKQINNWLSGGECDNVWGLSNGLIIGGTDKFDAKMKQNFRTLGLSHLVAVSGFQVILLISILEIILSKLNLSHLIKFGLGILGIILLILIVGPQPPVLRSSLGFLLTQSVLFLGRRISALRVLIYSSLILLLLNPFYLISVSFQLSFMASFGLVLGFGTDSIAGFLFKNEIKSNLQNSLLKKENKQLNIGNNQFHQILSEKIQSFWQFFVELFFATFNSFVFTLPIIINLSGQISPIAILTNLLIVPIIPFLTYFNLLALVPFLGIFPLFLTGIIQSLLILLINELSNFGLIWRMSNFQNWEFILYYSILIAFSLFLKSHNKEKLKN